MTQTPPSQPGPLSPGQGVPSQGGAPSPGVPGPPSGNVAAQPGAAAPKKSKAPKVLIILGSLILALSMIGGVVLAVIGFGGVLGSASEYEVFESGSGTVTAEAGDTLQLYAEKGEPTPQCTVDGPVVGKGTSQTSGFTNEGREWSSFDSFSAGEAGSYDIRCGDTPVMVGPPVSIGGIFAGLGGIFLAIGGGALGLLLLGIGVILLILRRKRA